MQLRWVSWPCVFVWGKESAPEMIIRENLFYSGQISWHLGLSRKVSEVLDGAAEVWSEAEEKGKVALWRRSCEASGSTENYGLALSFRFSNLGRGGRSKTIDGGFTRAAPYSPTSKMILDDQFLRESFILLLNIYPPWPRVLLQIYVTYYLADHTAKAYWILLMWKKALQEGSREHMSLDKVAVWDDQSIQSRRSTRSWETRSAPWDFGMEGPDK